MRPVLTVASNPQDAAGDSLDMPGLEMPSIDLSHDCQQGCLGCKPTRSSRRGKTLFLEVPMSTEDDHPATVGSCTEHNLVKSRFSVRNICCDSEVRLIERIVQPLPGVQSVSVNSFQKLCLVEHCSPCCTPPETILNKLNSSGLGAALVGQGGDEIHPQQLHGREWCRRYARCFVVLGAALCMVASGLMEGLGRGGATFQLIAVFMGLPGILWESCVALKQLQLDVTLLVSIAVVAAVGHGELFDAALVVLLFNIAKVIEAAAIRRVAVALRVVMQLQTVRSVQRAKDGKQMQISDLQSGDVISLRPGEQCPADGLVSAGLASCSEAAMTGEATPVEKVKGREISSGTLVLNGCIEVELTKPSSESRLSEIESRVQEAQAKRTERQMMIGRFARAWTPVVLVGALVTSMVPAVLGGDYTEWRHRAVVLLLIACPCAIVIGAPLATTCAIAAAASNGVLIKRPDTVERLPAVAVVALDKTGTLTKGEMTVLDVQRMNDCTWDETQALKLAAALEMKSAHPIAAAIVSRALGCIGTAYGSETATVKKVRDLPGVGIQGHLLVGSDAKVHKVLLGNSKALDLVNADAHSQEQFASFQEMHMNDTTVALIIDGKLQFGLALNDTLRPDSTRFIEELKGLGLRPYMLTGDSECAAKHISACAGLDPGSSLFSMTPDEKTEWVETQNAAGRKTLMLGDGINDATALAVATVGVAIGETGAALASQSAAVVLLTDKLHKLTQCIRMCKYAVRIERLSITIPCLLKLLQGVAALRGELDLWMAVVADLGTLLLVLVLGVSILSRRFWTDESLSNNLGGSAIVAKRQGYEEFV
ncbi:HMA2 [Symbiodinium natans]|uniref:HMA2 protein n=1 Tax=Symbiodinium natans TaxID=878477 RepID=A0A812R1F4_9DINO|nr:HMA2 [Symbiodinium natans]